MADYLPLISRAIDALPDGGTREQRDAIYARARDALIRQLRSPETALSEAEITRERLALESAFSRLERLVAGRATAIDPEQEDDRPLVTTLPLQAEVAEPQKRPRVPIAPVATGTKSGKNNLAVVLAACLPILLGIAIAAYILKDKPEDFVKTARQSPLTTSSVQSPAESDSPTATMPVERKATEPPVLPVAVRAAFYVADPANAENRLEKRGAVVWRLESEASDQDTANLPRIRGEMEFPDIQLRAEFVIRRNLEQSLPASHTIDLKFTPMVGNATVVKSASLPEFREDPLKKGPTPRSVKAPDTDNAFLFALVNSEPFLSTNIELLKKPGWIYFDLRLADGSRAELLFEKGVAGERVFNEAFRAWDE